MTSGCITLVLRETVLRIAPGVVPHQPITSDLGQHTRCTDGKTESIALNQGGLRKRYCVHMKPVHQNMLWWDRQPMQASDHGMVRSPKNVELVNNIRFHLGNGVMYRWVLNQPVKAVFPPRRGELF